MVGFPLVKLLHLGIKQISKPVANQLKRTAKTSSFFGKYVCSPPARALHRMEMFVKFRLMGAKGPIEYAPLSEEKAIEIGSEMLGELFLYTTAASYIVYEYWKGVTKDKERDATQDEQGESLKILSKRLKILEDDIKKLNGRLEKIGATPPTVSPPTQRTSNEKNK